MSTTHVRTAHDAHLIGDVRLDRTTRDASHCPLEIQTRQESLKRDCPSVPFFQGTLRVIRSVGSTSKRLLAQGSSRLLAWPRGRTLQQGPPSFSPINKSITSTTLSLTARQLDRQCHIQLYSAKNKGRYQVETERPFVYLSTIRPLSRTKRSVPFDAWRARPLDL